MSKWKEIEAILVETDRDFDKHTRLQLFEKLSIYREELVFQNEELRRINENIETIKNDYRELFEFSPIAYFVITNKGQILEANKSTEEFFGKLHYKNILEYIDIKSHGDFCAFLNVLTLENKANIDVKFIHEEMSVYMKVMAQAIKSKPGHYLLACVDFEHQHRMMNEIKELSYKDHLTSLYNRRYLDDKIYHSIHRGQLPLSLIAGDVNGLKLINDAFGHMKGDELLKNTADILKKLIKDDGVIARIGGDEFLIVLPNTTHEECLDAMEILDSGCLSELKVNGVSFSVSFGCATMENINDDIEDILKKAEKDMYKSKVFNESIRNPAIIGSIVDIFHKRQPEEYARSKRVSDYMKRMGEYYLYDKSHIKNMALIGFLHNIGKISASDKLIGKGTSFASADFEEVKKCHEVAYHILKSSSKYSKIAHIVLHQSEWIDGSGYPNGLEHDEIPFESKVLSVCIAYDLMTTETTYRSALSRDDAIAELEAATSNRFDEEVVRDFTSMLMKNED